MKACTSVTKAANTITAVAVHRDMFIVAFAAFQRVQTAGCKRAAVLARTAMSDELEKSKSIIFL